VGFASFVFLDIAKAYILRSINFLVLNMPGDIMSHHELDHRAILQEEIAGYEPQ
jgi:hypothetical protein